MSPTAIPAATTILQRPISTPLDRFSWHLKR
jgi:hypothetical protein